MLYSGQMSIHSYKSQQKKIENAELNLLFCTFGCRRKMETIQYAGLPTSSTIIILHHYCACQWPSSMNLNLNKI